MTSTQKKVLLGVVLTFGGLVRLYGAKVGVYDVYVHDEIFEIFRALELLRGEFDFYRPMKGFFYFLLAGLYSLYGGVLLAAGKMSSFEEFVSYSIVHPGVVIFLSRTANAAIGTLSIYLIYRIGKKIFPNERWGPEILLAFMWATCWLAIWISSWGFVETCLVTLSLLATFPVLNIYRGGGTKDYLKAGMWIGMATATKIYGITLLFLLCSFHFLNISANSGHHRIRKFLDRRLYLGLVGFCASWLALDPSILTLMLAKFHLVDPSLFDGPVFDVPAERHFWFFLDTIRWNLGNGLMPFIVLGVIMAAVDRNKEILILFIFSILFLLAFGFIKTAVVYQRYMLLALPYFFLTGIYGIISVVKKIENIQILRTKAFITTWGTVLAITLFVAWNGLSSLLKNEAYAKSFVPVEIEAKRWFESEIPAGSKILMKGEFIWPGHQTIPLYDLKENYAMRFNNIVRISTRRKNMNALLDLAQAEGLVRYDLLVVDRHEKWKNLNEYMHDGIEYAVIDVQQFTKDYEDIRSQEGKESRIRLYGQIKESDDVKLVKKFDGKDIQGRRKIIEVYKIDNLRE